MQPHIEIDMDREPDGLPVEFEGLSTTQRMIRMYPRAIYEEDYPVVMERGIRVSASLVWSFRFGMRYTKGPWPLLIFHFVPQDQQRLFTNFNREFAHSDGGLHMSIMYGQSLLNPRIVPAFTRLVEYFRQPRVGFLRFF